MAAPSWVTRTFVALQVLRAEHLNEIANNLYLLQDHAHTNVDGDGASTLSGNARSVVVVLWPRFALTTTNFSFSASTTMMGRCLGSSTVQDALLQWPVALSGGTWRLDILYARGSNQIGRAHV